MNRFTLERQADLIEAVLAAHKIPGRVLGGTVTPRVIRFDLATTLGVRLQKILALKDELALSLGVPSVRLYREGNALRVEVPRPQPAVVHLLPLCRSLPKPPPLTAVLGIDIEGIPLLLRLPSPDVAHVLIAGTTGSGKTALLRSLVLSLALFNPQRRLQLVVIDPKGRGFGALAGLPHLLRPVVTETAVAVDLLDGLVVEMERRDREARNEPALVVVIDELADLRQTGGKAVEERLSRLTQRGREAGMHVVVATQRPTAAVLGGLVKANLPVRLVGAVSSAEEARLATGVAGSGAERLRGRGDFLLVTHGEMIRLQAAYIGEAETARVVADLRANVIPPSAKR
jgi:S-DNA-T family DNA segregation ATPase FtsK/SpoIIIE